MLYSIYSAEERAPEITHHVVGGRNLAKDTKKALNRYMCVCICMYTYI